jgi:hypothetical protein
LVGYFIFILTICDQCFGEWFASLSVKDSTTKSIFAKDSPANRWLKEIIGLQLEKTAESGDVPMQSLHEFCKSSEELVRAFWLATLCREAVFQAASEKEDATYGKVSKEESGEFKKYSSTRVEIGVFF